ncbi:hypothetical protein RBU49_02445 [Clostridium sp. MB40-C1]|uniref:BclA C-terminal domain-containing protein n=1 Tax=Clostridium sp. MB40-C1 TaxID=3070996 RepID=UPI0027E1A36D|nr:hypothetical protein [Clostridium sp. MB40-C1]WMJ81129.1 hypothetical protein RBU49_02445 [Clostridium sp. MB40-C1]
MGPCTSNRPLAICTAPCNGGGNGGAGFTDYAYIYNLGEQEVEKGTDVKFSNNEILSGGITHTPGEEEIALAKAGVYYIEYYAYAQTPTQFGLYLDGNLISVSTVYSQGNSAAPIMGMAIVRIANPGDLTLRLIDTAGMSTTLMDDKPATSDIDSVTASIVIIRIAD